MDFGLLIIGDEILHGTRVDAHFSAVKSMLADRGLRLKWVTYLADEPEQIVASSIFLHIFMGIPRIKQST